MGGSGSDRQVTTQTNLLAPVQQQAFDDLTRRAVDASNQVPNQPFQGQRVAALTPDQLQALDLTRNFANSGPLQQTGGQLSQNALATARGDFLDPNTNPFLQDAIQAAILPVQQNFERNILPQIQSQAVQQGAFGGARQDISEAVAAEGALRQQQALANQLVFDNFNRERQNQVDAAAQADAAARIGLQPAQLLASVGDINQAQNQLQLDQAQQLFQESRTAPFLPLQQLNAILQGSPQTTIVDAPVGQQGGAGGGVGGALTGALGGAGTGASLGTVLGSAAAGTAVAPGIGTIIGALLGGGVGGFAGA